uniref:Uncharacterized protein n=1 Tax=Serinus canaria TaxID=9135 RepID=A0A8C9MUS5_SERCA
MMPWAHQDTPPKMSKQNQQNVHLAPAASLAVGRCFSVQLASGWCMCTAPASTHHPGATQDPPSPVSGSLAGVQEKWAHCSGAGVWVRKAVLYSEANYCRQQECVQPVLLMK